MSAYGFGVTCTRCGAVIAAWTADDLAARMNDHNLHCTTSASPAIPPAGSRQAARAAPASPAGRHPGEQS